LAVHLPDIIKKAAKYMQLKKERGREHLQCTRMIELKHKWVNNINDEIVDWYNNYSIITLIINI